MNCKTCNKTFKSKKAFQNHLNSKAHQNKVNKKHIVHCDHCDESMSMQKYLRHIKTKRHRKIASKYGEIRTIDALLQESNNKVITKFLNKERNKINKQIDRLTTKKFPVGEIFNPTPYCTLCKKHYHTSTEKHNNTMTHINKQIKDEKVYYTNEAWRGKDQEIRQFLSTQQFEWYTGTKKGNKKLVVDHQFKAETLKEVHDYITKVHNQQKHSYKMNLIISIVCSTGRDLTEDEKTLTTEQQLLLKYSVTHPSRLLGLFDPQNIPGMNGIYPTVTTNNDFQRNVIDRITHNNLSLLADKFKRPNSATQPLGIPLFL